MVQVVQDVDWFDFEEVGLWYVWQWKLMVGLRILVGVCDGDVWNVGQLGVD